MTRMAATESMFSNGQGDMSTMDPESSESQIECRRCFASMSTAYFDMALARTFDICLHLFLDVGSYFGLL